MPNHYTNAPLVYPEEFEGQPLITLIWDGRPCWVARHIGARLGYRDKDLPNKVLGECADEFVPGHDYALLQGEDLASFHAAIVASGLPPSGRGTLLVLFESGLHLVLAKTNLPIGKRLRRFLVSEALPLLDLSARQHARDEALERIRVAVGMPPSGPADIATIAVMMIGLYRHHVRPYADHLPDAPADDGDCGGGE